MINTFKQFLQEDYYSRVSNKRWNTSFEMFKNPSLKEVKQFEYIRAIFYPSGNWYVSDGSYGLHREMVGAIQESGKDKLVAVTGYMYKGTLDFAISGGEMSGGSWVNPNYSLNMDGIREMLNKNKHLNRSFKWTLK